MTNSPPDSEFQTLFAVKRAAKALLRALEAGEPAALARLRAVYPHFARKQAAGASFRLHQAQLTIARESGFASWPRLKAWFDWKEGRDAPLQVFRGDAAYFRDRAFGLKSMLDAGDQRAREQARLYHPRFRDLPEEDPAWDGFSPEDADLVVARQHGFQTWPAFEAHLQALASKPVHTSFRRAFEAIEASDEAGLEGALADDPAIVEQAGTNGNSLLNLAAATVVRPDLGKPSCERRFALVDMLLAAGADPDRANQKGWTPLHQAAYSDNVPLAKRLVEAGATVDLEAYDDGGTPLVVALWWGHRAVSEYLAGLAVTPDNLRVAAGLGRLDRLAAMFDAAGKPLPAAGKARAFHRPHSGFPAWQPTPGHVQEILDDAFSFAARSGRIEAMAYLNARGAEINGVACNGSPLQWAVIQGRTEAVAWLLAQGADVNLRADFARNEGQTALHSAAFADRPDILQLLVEAGGDLTLRDRSYQSTPLGWAVHLGRSKSAEFIVETCWRRCDLEDLIAAGASLDTIAARVDADPGSLEGRNGTPLRAAAAAGRAEVVGLLLRHGADGADGAAKSRDGKTARDLAAEAGHGEVVAVLNARRE